MFRPFEKLKSLLEGKSLPPGPCPAETYLPHIDAEPDDPAYDRKLFMAAMADVKPLPRGKHIEIVCKSNLHSGEDEPNPFYDSSEGESLIRLQKLVDSGEGIVLTDTSEYIEGKGYCDNPEITDRLHRGDFSMQGFIDLHGFGADAAQDAFDLFIKSAILTGKRAVLVIHGRGLSSRDRPVLKSKVQDWLTRGPLRKWVIAFSSARSCDGGTGATYILLRQRPYTKRFRKKHKKR